MIIGLLLIGTGVVIALYPQILVAAISGFFILSGVMVLMMQWRWRRVGQDMRIHKFWWGR